MRSASQCGSSSAASRTAVRGTEDGDLGRVEEDGRRQLVPDAANGAHTNIVLRCKEGSSTREAICNRPALRHAPPDQRQPEDDLRYLQN